MTMPKILFLTNSESGQSNVILAVATELLLLGNIELHIGSFSSLEQSVKTLNTINNANGTYDKSNVVFHLIPGDSMAEAFRLHNADNDWLHRPGFRGALQGFSKAANLLVPWPDLEYIGCYEACVDLIKSLAPDLIVLDPLFSPGIDACVSVGKEFAVLSPNSFREQLIGTESVLKTIFKFPISGTGWAYPMPLWRGFQGLILTFGMVYKLITCSRTKSLLKTRKEHGIKTKFPFASPPFAKDRLYLLPATPETDFPCHIPSNVISCGPIIRPSPELSLVDSDVAKFLDKGATVLVNLGTHRVADPVFALELATGLKTLLDSRPTIQVLWKLKSDKDNVVDVKNILLTELAEDRVRIETWLKAEPSAIVAHKNIVCSVHHGGANSFNEAIAAGVPHIVLPCWYDTYQYAARVEWLGIGIYANKSVAPSVDGKEFGEALIAVTRSENQMFMAQKAKDIAVVTGKYGGRNLAASLLAEAAEKGSKVNKESKAGR